MGLLTFAYILVNFSNNFLLLMYFIILDKVKKSIDAVHWCTSFAICDQIISPAFMPEPSHNLVTFQEGAISVPL